LTTNEKTAWRGASDANHFTGLSVGTPLGDQRLDLCDLYAFQSPTDSSRTVLILNANPNADALHPDAICRLAIDTDGDLVNDIAFSLWFSSPLDGRQTVSVFMARGADSRSPDPAGGQIGDALANEVGQLLDQVDILQQGGAVGCDRERVLVTGDRTTGIRGGWSTETSINLRQPATRARSCSR
jgi:Domain of unknown function (DUF4331)